MKVDKVSEFFSAQHLRSPEENEVREYMKQGLTFEEAFQQVWKDWKDAESDDEFKSSELESFATTARWLLNGDITLDNPIRE